jgi:D-beta-D-heptose 7-phosphate kinase/D-beta-D-heptose 1-phosphate adenosyltransferase
VNARILVVGDAMADIYIPTKVERISPEAPVPVVVKNGDVRTCPGGALNVAANAAALGAEVTVVAAVGADADGEALRRELAAHGITTNLVDTPGVGTITKTRFLARTQQIMRVDHETGKNHYAACANNISEALRAALEESPDYVLLSDYGKGTIASAHLDILRDAYRSDGIRTIVDPTVAEPRAYHGLWGLKANRSEAEVLLGRTLSDWDEVEEGARALQGWGFETVWITLGAMGSISITADDEAIRHPGRARSVFDVVGAGDTYLAALGVSLGEGNGVSDATNFANAAAGVAVESSGTTVVSRADVPERHPLMQNNWERRLLDYAAAAATADRCRALHYRIGFTNGCFDVLHPGHVDSLEWAAKQVDVLFVGVNADETVRAAKGLDRPVLSCADRCRMLIALRAVDYVVPFHEATPEELIRCVRPDVLFKGEEWAHYVAGRDIVEGYGGRIELVPRSPGYSTTGLIERVRRGAVTN